MPFNTDTRKKSRLKSNKIIKEIFNSGTVVYSANKKLRAHYLLRSGTDEPGIKFSVAVSKKAGNAVWRNRAKRLMREAKRLSSEDLNYCCLENEIEVVIVFTTNNINEKNKKNLSLNDIQPPIEDILNKIKSGITSSLS